MIRSAATFPPNEGQLWPIARQWEARILRRAGQGIQLVRVASLLVQARP